MSGTSKVIGKARRMARILAAPIVVDGVERTTVVAGCGFEEFDAAGWPPDRNSLLMAGMASVIGTVLVFIGAYFVEMRRGPAAGPAAVAFRYVVPERVERFLARTFGEASA